MKTFLLMLITNHATDATSHLIEKVGRASIMTAVGMGAAKQAGFIEMASSFSETFGTFDWLAILAGLGTITFIIKNILGARKLYLEVQLLKIKKDDNE